MLKPRKWMQIGFPTLLFLFSLISLASPSTVPLTFITTIAGTFETGSIVLTASPISTASGISSTTTTLTYLNNYAGTTPQFGYGFSFINSQWPMVTSQTETIFDVSVASGGPISQVLQLNFTAGSVALFSINYLLCSTSFFLDVRTFYTDLTTTSVYPVTTGSSRSTTLNLPAKTKSNSSNTVATYTTVGLSMMRASDTFEFQLATIENSTSNIVVNLTLMSGNAMRFIRINVFNYERVVTVITSPYFMDIGTGVDLGGTVADSSGLVMTTTGTIFMGMVDWQLTDYFANIAYNMSLSGKVYSLSASNAVTRTQTAYVWYRQAVCPTYYFNQSNVCAPCHISCLTCISGANTGCTSCDSNSNRNLLVSNYSCPCKTNYVDIGSAVCQLVRCYDTCVSCSTDYVCSSCNSATQRTLVNGSCVCGSYTVDFYTLMPSSNYITCQLCFPTCLTCQVTFPSITACLSCSLTRDHRTFNSATSSCDCVGGYFQNPNTTARTFLFNYIGSPCLPCAYSCATCTGNTTCLTCNASLNRVYNSTSRLCSCSPGYYDNNLIQSCFSCPYSCLTCTSSTFCLTCPNTRTPTNNLCPCTAGFYQSGVVACQACNYTCATCTSSSSCSSCNNLYSRSMSNGSCLCSAGFYDTYSSQICLPCDSTCLTCTGAAANTCTSCNSALFRVLTTNKTCDCKLGYFYDLGLGSCTPCNYPCESCADGSTCASCSGTSNRFFSGSTCLCNNKFYDDGGNHLCKSCMYFCLTCSGPAACLTCHSTRNSTNLATCPCLSGYYDDGISSNCQTCLASCLTCNNPTNCTSCAANRTITTVASCACMSRTYQPYCNACEYSCLACLGVSSNCTSCNGTAMRYLDSATFKCVCYQGFYDDTQNQLCQSCNYSCLTCSSATSCLTCPVNRVMSGSFCSCNSTFYQNSQNYSNCLPCHYSCLTCSSYSVCSTCDGSSQRITSVNTTLCVCSPGYYDNLVGVLCIKCDSICLTCSAFTVCTTCNVTLNFYYSSGTCLCNTGYYFDSTSRTCIACHYSCNTCLGGTSCATCKQNRTLTSTFCTCNDGLFDNSVTQTCSLCTSPCITCTNSSTNCLSCDNTTRRLNTLTGTCACFGSTYDTGLNCPSCLPTCQTCTNGSACSSCLSGSSRVPNGNNLCVCPTGYHDENGTSLICSGCQYSCATCINSISCSTCSGLRSGVVGGFCVCPADHYYDNGRNSPCIACSNTCLRCSTISTNCTSCLDSTFRTLVNNTCTCTAGYYDDLSSATCPACHYSCQLCTAGASCSVCNATNKRVYVNGPLCICMDGYFDTSNVQLCTACSYTCLTCVSSATLCLSCPTNRTLANASSTCPCNDGLYDSGVTTCASCLYSCATCTNGTTCLTCPSTRIGPSVAQLCPCRPGTFDAAQTLCSNCAPTCLECSAYQVCTLCDTNTTFRQLTNTSCTCPSGYFDSSFSSNYVCQLCSYSCATCVSNTQCTSCNINYQRVYNANTTLCSCANGFYDDGSHAPCLPCPSDCVTCSNSTTCLICPSVRLLASNGRCSCINTTYANGTNCESCPVECLTCQNSSYCNTCVGSRILVNNACICPSGLYSVAGTSTCNGCHHSCSTCLASSQCSTCNSTLGRYQTSTFCLCMAGTYDDGQNQTCKSCSYSCQLCSTGTTCLSCNSANNRILNTNTSLCECISGYYEDVNTKACIQCQVSCVTCTNGSACTSCNQNYKRELDSSNQCTCLAVGYFDTFLSPICSACHYSCLSCSGSAAYCTSCNNITMRSLSTSACVCMNGYYDVVPQPICLTCSVRCVTCLGSGDNCTQCSSANHRGTTPNCSCITGYYDKSVAACAACNYVCLTCTMSQACTTCDLNISHRAINNISNLCDCVQQFYDAGANICLSCLYSCLTCSVSSSCLSCPSTRLLTVGQCPCLQKYYDDLSSLNCLACDYTCQSCRSGTTCFSCDATRMRTFNSTTFRCSCMLGYYDTGIETCSKCDSSCYSCINATACASCPPNINKTLNASSGSNFCVCLYAYYQNVTAGVALGYSSVCNPCYYACQTCTNQATYCTLCLNSSNRYLTASHQCACNVGTFEIYGQQTCITCYSNCLTCTGTGSNNCLTCDNTTYFLNNTCYTSCPQYYNVSAATRTCVSCSSNCISCATSYTVCSRCKSPYFIFSYNSSYSICVNSCPSYYYQINSTCYPCLSPCLACTAAYTCTSCINLYYLTSGNCNPCHALCLTCSGSTALDCLTCVPNYILRGSICQKLSCLPTQYVHSVAGCLNCTVTFSNSLTCLSTGPTSCLDGYILSNSSCLTCSAVTGYTYSSATGKCQDFCGDNIIITDLCDDGNNLNGDGCSSVCTIESDWSCPGNTCTLLAQPTVTVVSMSNNPRSHTITLTLVLSIGLRLVTANFVLSFSSITQYSYSVVALDSYYKTYQLTIVYYQTAANNNLMIQIKSPVSRLLLTTNSTLTLSISLQLTVSVPIVTSPPAIYVSEENTKVYTMYLVGVMAALHVLLLVVAIIFLMMRLKVMLLIIDAFNSLTILYILTALGMYGVSLLSYEAMRGLQPFFYAFGSSLPASNLSYFGYSSNFFGTSIIQAFIIVICFLLSAYFTKREPSEEQNPWHYYRVGFAFAFSYDFLLACFSTFFWNPYSSYQSSYSWMFALLFLIYLSAEGVVYFARMRESSGDGKKVVPAISFITNELEIKDKGKEVNIFEFEDEASKEKRKGILSEFSDQQTQVIAGEAVEAEPKRPDETVRYYDLTPSSQTQYSMSNSNHISAVQLPVLSLLFPFVFAIVVNIQTATIRSALFLVLSILHLLSIVLTKNSKLKSLRNVKLIVFSIIYVLLSILALFSSVNAQTADLVKLDIVIASLVMAAVIFNIVALVGGVVKSEAYREYLINRKNEEIMQRTKKQNETRMKIYAKNETSKQTNKPIKPNNNANNTNIFLEEPESFEVHQTQPVDIQVSEQHVEEKEIKLSSLKKRRDDPTMLHGNSSSINQHIDQEVSDFNNSDFRPHSDLLNDKQLEGRQSPEPRSPSKKQGNRIRAINSSAISLVSRKGETPSLFFENSLQRIDELKGVKRNLDKSQQKEEVDAVKRKPKRKKRPNMETDVIGNEDHPQVKVQQPRQSKQRMVEKVQRDSGEVLEGILEEMDMPRGFMKPQDSSFRARIMSIDDISSIHEQREQFAMQEREQEYEGSVFNKILQDYQKYKYKKVDKKKLKDIKGKKVDKS